MPQGRIGFGVRARPVPPSPGGIAEAARGSSAILSARSDETGRPRRHRSRHAWHDRSRRRGA